MNDFRTIPIQLKSLQRWILWRKEMREGKATKVPVSPQGTPISVTDPKHWSDFPTMDNAFDPKRFSGIGFVLTKEDGITCLDLDGCIDENGNIVPEAMHIVERINSWSEISQSGRGIHIFIRATKLTNKAKATPREFKALEIYDDKRFIAITANHLQGTPTTVEERQAELNALCDEYFHDPEPHTESTSPQSVMQNPCLSDEQIIDLCRKARNARKFEALFDRGDVSLYNGDESAADQALTCMLAFYTQDAAQLERLMSASALGQREKWRRREDYRRRTIQAALSQVREHYTPKHNTASVRLADKYPLQSIAPADADDFDDDPDEQTFIIPREDSLLFSPLMREIYETLTINDPPPAFALIGAISVIQTIIGDNITFKVGNESIRTNDFHVLIGESGIGKSTVLNSVKKLLHETANKFVERKPAFLLPARITERGLKDALRSQTEAEREKSIDKQAVTSGLIASDEFLSWLTEFRAQHSSGLLSLLLELWQGAPIRIATAKRTDGVYEIPPTSISILGAITPEAFWRNVPLNSESIGFFSRLNLVFSEAKTERRTLFDIVANGFDNHNSSLEELAIKLAQFHAFVCKKTFITIAPECTSVGNEAIRKWNEILEKFIGNEAITSYGQRLQVRLLKYSLLLETVKAFEQGRNEIRISAETVEQATPLVNFLFSKFVEFVLQHRLQGFANDTLGRIKQTVVAQVKAAGQDGLSFWELFRKNSVAEHNLQKALDELVKARVLELYEKQGKGRHTQKYRYLRKSYLRNSENSRKLSENNDLQERNFAGSQKSLTYENPENSRKSFENKDLEGRIFVGNPTYENTYENPRKLSENKDLQKEDFRRYIFVGKEGENVVTPEPTTNPMPADVPEPTPLTACDVVTPEPPAPMLTDVVTPEPTPLTVEPKALRADIEKLITKTLDHVEAKPEPTNPMPVPQGLSDDDLTELALNYLMQMWSCRRIPGEQLRHTISTICGERSESVWKRIFPDHIVKLHTTDFYILRDNAHRPKGYEGLLDDKGVLPDADPMPF